MKMLVEPDLRSLKKEVKDALGFIITANSRNWNMATRFTVWAAGGIGRVGVFKTDQEAEAYIRRITESKATSGPSGLSGSTE